jgi:hypothetical protein
MVGYLLSQFFKFAILWSYVIAVASFHEKRKDVLNVYVTSFDASSALPLLDKLQHSPLATHYLVKITLILRQQTAVTMTMPFQSGDQGYQLAFCFLNTMSLCGLQLALKEIPKYSNSQEPFLLSLELSDGYKDSEIAFSYLRATTDSKVLNSRNCTILIPRLSDVAGMYKNLSSHALKGVEVVPYAQFDAKMLQTSHFLPAVNHTYRKSSDLEQKYYDNSKVKSIEWPVKQKYVSSAGMTYPFVH